jgi:hypothetical protein
MRWRDATNRQRAQASKVEAQSTRLLHGQKNRLTCRVDRKAILASLAAQGPIFVGNMRRTFDLQVT